MNAPEPIESLTVVVATSGFRSSLGPRRAAAAIAEGVHEVKPASRVLPVPVIDGGNGFAEELTQLWSGRIEHVDSVDAQGAHVASRLGLAGPATDRTAIIGVDEATDLRSLPPDRRDPSRASSRGTGRLIAAALDRGVRRIVIGCGDSGANDGGIGMAAELGIRFLDSNRMEIVEAGGLQRLASIDMSRRDPRLARVSIEVVVNPFDVLLGERGAVRLFTARSGACETQMRRLERGLERYAVVVREASGEDVTRIPGGGAGGGLGAGLAVFLGAKLTPRLDFLRHGLGVEDHLAMADLAIAVADAHDGAAAASEVPGWVAWRARTLGLPVVTLAGPDSSDSPPPHQALATTKAAPVPVRPEAAYLGTREWLRRAGRLAIHAAFDRMTPASRLPGPSHATPV